MPRLWRFGDNIDTDQIVPGRYAPYMTADNEMQKYAFIERRPEFAQEVQEGDIIVAGRNFGCGSSREYATLALRRSPIAGIIAQGFARIFYRNATNLGMALFRFDGAGNLPDGADAALDVASGELRVDGTILHLQPAPAFVREIAKEGTIVDYFRKYRRFPGVTL